MKKIKNEKTIGIKKSCLDKIAKLKKKLIKKKYLLFLESKNKLIEIKKKLK